jgi:uracil-DNA glycosylase family 4
MTDDAALDELRFLTRALRAHLDWQSATGALGLERAPQETQVVAATAALPAHAILSASHAALSSVVGQPSTAAERPAEGDVKRRLAVLADAVSACTRCGLAAQRKQTVFARGTGSSGICFVGEGPGADEDAQGLPFVGAAGQLLDKMIAAMGLARDDVYVCNVVKCRPPDNRKPDALEMAACLPYLEQQLVLIRPQVIVALGATAVQGLLGSTEGITRLRGKWQLFRGQIAVMPTFHPAYLLRTPAAKREVWEDLQQVLQRVGRSTPARR